MEVGNNKRVIIGVLTFLSIALLGYNAYKFSALYDTPLIGPSHESISAGEKWRSLESIEQNKKNATWIEKIKNFKKETPLEVQTVEEAVSVVDPMLEQQQKLKKDVLPDIIGLIKISEPDGKSRSAVVIENKIFYERETVSGFFIKEITEKGIYLTKGKRSWFIDAPKVSYSMDRGNK